MKKKKKLKVIIKKKRKKVQFILKKVQKWFLKEENQLQ